MDAGRPLTGEATRRRYWRRSNVGARLQRDVRDELWTTDKTAYLDGEVQDVKRLRPALRCR